MFSKRVTGLVGAVGVLLTLGACTTPVRYDADPRADLSGYRTYVFEAPKTEDSSAVGGAAFTNPLNEQRLRDAVAAQLAARGLQPAPEGAKPDAFVTVAFGTRQNFERDYYRFPMRVGFGFGTWRPGFGSGMYFANDSFYDVREGRISVDFYDASNRKPLWHATVEQDLSYLTGDNAARRIDTVVSAMFAKFPLAAGTGAAR